MQKKRKSTSINSGRTEKLLDVPQLDDGKGQTLANAVYHALCHWGLNTRVKGVCCDTTNANLGAKNGAATLLEDLLWYDLLYLPCRHHIFEIILSACFENKLPGTNGPNAPLFKRFQEDWDNIDKKKYKTGLDGNTMDPKLSSQIPDIIKFIVEYLNKQQPRDDYKELLLLCKIFLGGSCDKGFYKPGTYRFF